jgi:tetratricopeptide (TPR) repeat protein
MRPESSDYHTLFSLIYYLRQEKMHAKAEAVIANAENPRNGRALILYGLSIGRKAKDGDAYIRQGLIWYPMNREAPSVYPDPFEVLIPDLAPWLVGNRSSDPPQYQQLMDEARELYIHGEWKKSKRFFEDAWALEPELSEAPLYLARIKIAEKDLKGAMKSLNNLRKRFPEDAATVLFQGYVYELLKKFGNAEILYRKSLEMEPENHRAMLRLSTLLIKTGKYEEARSFLESLTRKYPDYTVGWWNLGLLYQKIDELESAEQALEEVVRLDPANTRVQAQLEHIREELDRNISQ